MLHLYASAWMRFSNENSQLADLDVLWMTDEKRVEQMNEMMRPEMMWALVMVWVLAIVQVLVMT